MNLNYYYWYFKKELSPHFCNKIIDTALKRKKLLGITHEETKIAAKKKNFKKLSKKFTDDDLKKDLARSWVVGTTNVESIICISVKNIEKINKKLISCNLLTPKFQNMINSLLISYFVIT